MSATDRAQKVSVVVLAAGLGRRMNLEIPKPMAPFAGRPILDHILDRLDASALEIDRIALVIGQKGEVIVERYSGRDDRIRFARQDRPLGTAHAVLAASSALPPSGAAPVLVLPGDAPLIGVASIESALECFYARIPEIAVAFLTARLRNPGAYGRIERDARGRPRAIVEAKDATAEQARIDEVNSGIYIFDRRFLFDSLRKMIPSGEHDPAGGEYYLTDLVEMAHRASRAIESVEVSDPLEIMGANTLEELEELEERSKSRRA